MRNDDPRFGWSSRGAQSLWRCRFRGRRPARSWSKSRAVGPVPAPDSISRTLREERSVRGSVHPRPRNGRGESSSSVLARRDSRGGDAVVVADGPRCWRCPSCLRGEDRSLRRPDLRWCVGPRRLGIAPYLHGPRTRSRAADFAGSDPRGPARRRGRDVVPRSQQGQPETSEAFDGNRYRGRRTGALWRNLRQLTSSRVIAVDSAPHRLEVAQQLGGDVALRRPRRLRLCCAISLRDGRGRRV